MICPHLPIFLALIATVSSESYTWWQNPYDPLSSDVHLRSLKIKWNDLTKTKSQRENSCPHSCSELPYASVEYCSDVVWSVCRTESSWVKQDALVEASLESLGIEINLPLVDPSTLVSSDSKGEDIGNVTDNKEEPMTEEMYKCLQHLVKLECNLKFPPCEIGTEVRQVCRSTCEKFTADCGEMLELPSTFCDDLNVQEKDTGNCVRMSYEGANRMLWIAGFSIALAFSFLAALGLNLQKLSMNKEKGMPVHMRRPPIKQPLWVIGLTLITSGSLLDFVAFGMAPQSLLAPLGALSLVWNLIIAPLFHSEKLTQQNMTATGIICFGTIMTVIAAPHSTPTYTLKDLEALYKEPVMQVYMAGVFTFMASMALTLRRIGYGGEGEEGESAGGERERATKDNPQGERVRGSSLDLGRVDEKDREMQRIICFGGIAGCFGGCSVLLAKSTAELVKNALFENGADAFEHSPVPYIIMTLMICCLLTQITILNKGLSRFNALLMVPVYQSFWNGSSVLGGIIYFQEYRDLSPVAAGFFILGISVTMGGVVYLLRERRKEGVVKKGGKRYEKLGSVSSDDDLEGLDNEEDEDSLYKGDVGMTDKIEMSDFNRSVILGGGGDDDYGDGGAMDRYKMGPRSRTNSTEI